MNRTAVVSLCLGASILAGGLTRSNLLKEELEPPSIKAEIGGQNVISVFHNRNTITAGINRAEREANSMARPENGSNREVLARERGESYTGTGNGIEIIGYSKENCVQYAKRITGINRTVGTGGRRGIQGSEPRVGAIGVEKTRTHAVVIEKIEGEKITITEANFLRGRITRRVLRLNDLMGFIYG